MANTDQNSDSHKVLTEGKAKILMKGNEVFYNEAQVTNRDLSVAVLRSFLPLRAAEIAAGTLRRKQKGGRTPKQPSPDAPDAAPAAAPAAAPPAAAPAPAGGVLDSSEVTAAAAAAAAAAAPSSDAFSGGGARILEGLAASGLRSIRYALELDGVSRVDANDLDPSVVDTMRANIAFNGGEAGAKVHACNEDARLLMLKSHQVYDAVDLDPYGTPAHLLDSAVQSVSEGGLLMVTATDMAVLCGNSGEVCWTKYGSYPIHRPYCHESAVRILLASIEQHANRYKRYITPLLSLSIDFYVRVFVRVHTSASVVKRSATKLAYIYQSQGCDSWMLQRVGEADTRGGQTKFTPGHGPAVPQQCPETGARYLMGGPLWAEPIHDHGFVSSLIDKMDAEKERYAQHARIRGLLASVAEELPDVPLYYSLHDVCKTVHCTAPKAQVFRSAIINAGYRVSGSHANPLAVKTDAPPAVVWDIVRCWVRQHPVRDPDPNSYAGRLLAKEPKLEADFSRAPGSISKSQAAGIARFVQNPAYWGPKSRHGRPLSEQQERQYQAHAAAAGTAGPSGSNGSNARAEGAGAGEGAGQGEQRMAEAAELDELYGTLNDGAAGGGSSGNDEGGGRGDGDAGGSGAAAAVVAGGEGEEAQRRTAGAAVAVAEPGEKQKEPATKRVRR
ncbi:tRNA (guanine(26)-N(2))-dimethyltransferase-like [Raphidocelis subcapitata]|uniref:tRNA (guanine(26)-N(2))-dimethyltransferase n=1 Tax=Raphidocelis subcapitata TaxID=307507 RepID=A0A2V0P7J7_9CHLO|nr:tRNA (guanine(26)-N(2))-dimethyltransferase-like [Raphidocelis subcapitata]|eukprot:GBF93065.1 tRNA (guanine(26)-N(2))-dimethyltransferase-like [Raphidocelis subcapitata]